MADQRAVYTFMNGDPSPPRRWAYASHVLEPVTNPKTKKVSWGVYGAVVFHADDPDVCEAEAAAFLEAMQTGKAKTAMKIAVEAGKAVTAAKAAAAKNPPADA